MSIIVGFGLLLCGCAITPVETNSEMAAQRWAAMSRDCLKRGGIWNDEVHTCVGGDLIK